ncbi:vago [Cochliomyia hominivorax]
MFKLIIILIFIFNIIVIFGHPSSTYSRDRYNAVCTDPETNRELYIGEFFTRPGQCIRVQCLGTLQIWEDRCQVPQLEGNCYRLPAANEFLDYPRCCSNYECKSSKSDDKSTTDEIRLYDHYGRLLREHITQRVKVLIKAPGTVTTFNYTEGGKTVLSTRHATDNLEYKINNYS